MNLQTFATDHLESATPLDIQVAPAAITATFPDPEVGDDDYRWTAKLPRFMLSMSLDAETGHRIGNADLMLVTDGRRVLDHVVPGVDQDLTDLIDRVADFYILRYSIQRTAGRVDMPRRPEPPVDLAGVVERTEDYVSRGLLDPSRPEGVI